MKKVRTAVAGSTLFFKGFFFFCLISFCFSNALVAEEVDPKVEFETILYELSNVRLVVTDEESKMFLDSLFEEPASLRDDAVYERATGLLKRVYLVRDLEGILSSGEPVPAETRGMIEGWLEEEGSLNDPEVQQMASDVVKEITDRLHKRVEFHLLIKKLLPRARTAEEKKKLEEWLYNPILLDSPEVQAEIEALFLQMTVGGIPKKEAGSLFKFLRNLGVVAYTAYKKNQFMGQLLDPEGCVPGFFSRGFDHLVAVSYMLSKEWEKNSSGGIEMFIMSTFFNLPMKLEKWKEKWRWIVKDDVEDFIRYKTKKLLNQRHHDDWVEAFRERVKDGDVTVKEFTELCEDRARELTRDFGCPRRSLDFYSGFDREIIDMINDLLKGAGIPKSLQTIMKSSPVYLIEKIFLLKFLPAYLHWQVQTLRGETDPFWSSRLCLEAKKAAGKDVRFRLLRVLVKFLNRNKDGMGRGDLDRLRKKTAGLIGPNLIHEFLKVGVPRLNLVLSDRLDSVMGIAEPSLPHSAYFKEENENFKKHLSQSVISYSIRNSLFYFLSDFIGKHRPGVGRWLSSKAVGFVDFLGRRGWIDNDWWNDVKGATKELMGGGVFPVGSLVSLFLVSIQVLIWGAPKKMTEFDVAESWAAVSESGDFYKLFDYFTAFLIASKIGDQAALFCTRRM